MLVCPQCQFQNPNAHKFCQRCGLSLTQKPCVQCGTPVAFCWEVCPQCGHRTATTWWAIVTNRLLSDVNPDSTMPLNLSMASGAGEELTADDPGAGHGKSAAYLDPQQRYQLRQPLASSASNPQSGEIQFQVLDTQPLQISPLEVYASQLADRAAALDLSQPAAVTDYLRQLNGALPSPVPAYLGLHLQFPTVIPRLHDAWQEDQQQVLLLEDHSWLPELGQLWQQQTLSSQDLLRWLWQMLNLWVALSPWGCCQSLMKAENLRLHQSRELCLQRLHFADLRSVQPLSVTDLGHFWQQWLSQGPEPQRADLALLLAGLEADAVKTLEDLETLLQQVSDRLPDLSSIPGIEAADPLAATETVATGEADAYGGNSPTVILPNQLVKLEALGQTDVGRDRHHNEDYFVFHNHLTQIADTHSQRVQAKGLFILCDGMGGHAEGEVASALAATELVAFFQDHWQEELPSAATIQEAIYAANQAIYRLNEQQSRSGSGRMGTTLVAVLIQDLQGCAVHVGDSRLYRYTQDRGLKQMTLDHEVGQRDVRRGVEPEVAYARPDAFQLTQALGPRDQQALHPEVQFFTVEEDTLWLLCSDGLTDHQFLETHCESHIAPLLNFHASLEQGIQNLIDLANHCNGHDNITAVAIRMQVRPQRATAF